MDEVEVVIVFLDDCVHHCLKTPYRYLEDVRSLAQTLTRAPSNTGSEENYSFEIYPTLLMMIVEQLNSKVANKLLIPSQLDVLSITLLFANSCFTYQASNWIYNPYVRLQLELMQFYAPNACLKDFRCFQVLFDVK